MRWLNGFPFKTKEQEQKEQDDFKKMIIPFGEKQSAKALSIISTLLTSEKLKETEKLYIFFIAKEKYLQQENAENARAAVYSILEKQPHVSLQEYNSLLAFIVLESRIKTLDEYPTLAQIEEKANELENK